MASSVSPMIHHIGLGPASAAAVGGAGGPAPEKKVRKPVSPEAAAAAAAKRKATMEEKKAVAADTTPHSDVKHAIKKYFLSDFIKDKEPTVETWEVNKRPHGFIYRYAYEESNKPLRQKIEKYLKWDSRKEYDKNDVYEMYVIQTNKSKTKVDCYITIKRSGEDSATPPDEAQKAKAFEITLSTLTPEPYYRLTGPDVATYD